MPTDTTPPTTTDPKDARCGMCGSTSDVAFRMCGRDRRKLARRADAERWARCADNDRRQADRRSQ